MKEKPTKEAVNQTFLNIVKIFKCNEILSSKAKKGMCRMWCGEAVKILLINQELKKKLHLEIREVKIEPGLFHTFIRIMIENESYILDGTGVGKYDPYFGLESGASHLQNSQLDMLHRILIKG